MTGPKQQALTKFSPPIDPRPMDIVLQYATDPPIALRTLLDAIGEGLPPHPRICELGPGDGWLLEEMQREFPEGQLHALDMSASVVAGVRAKFGDGVPVARGDMERLPYRDEAFNVITTNWTLYFMDDIDAALEEIKRCVRPGGRVVAATVASDHLHEFDDLIAQAVRQALRREREPDIGERFNLENGETYMRRHFASVKLREWRGEMRLPDAETALALWRGYGPQLQDPDEDAAARRAFERLVRSVVARHGEFYITRHDGMFVANV